MGSPLFVGARSRVFQEGEGVQTSRGHNQLPVLNVGPVPMTAKAKCARIGNCIQHIWSRLSLPFTVIWGFHNAPQHIQAT